MPTQEPPILQFINAWEGSVGIPGVGVHLHWDLTEGVAWLKSDDGRKIFATDSDFHEIQDLWKAIFHLTLAFIDRDAYPEADLALLNSWAVKPSGVPTLGATGLMYHCSSISEALTLLAGEAVFFLGMAKHTHIKRCPGCARIFYDPSPTGRRKWCAMERCGNRAKARAFNEKRKAANEST